MRCDHADSGSIDSLNNKSYTNISNKSNTQHITDGAANGFGMLCQYKLVMKCWIEHTDKK